jgi:tetratricopeptide (TPR) repeat protein
VLQAGLALAPDDARLIELGGDLLARLGRRGEALARWQQAAERDPENLSPCYSRVFLLERLGRLEAAAAEWREILNGCEMRHHTLDAQWARRELARSKARLGDD